LTLSADQNNWNPTVNEVGFGADAALFVTTTGNVNISGMVPSIGGELKTLVNVGSSFITILDQSSLSDSSNRFSCGSDVIIAPGNAAEFIYNPVSNRWLLMSLRGGVQSAMPILVSGGSLPIAPGVIGWLEVPANCTISGWKLTSLQTCTISVDVWNAPFAGFPPTVANSICGGNLPTLSNQKSNSDTVLTGWTTSLSKGSIVMFNLSATDARAIQMMFSLDVIRTQ
jgi:hypothetical protein